MVAIKLRDEKIELESKIFCNPSTTGLVDEIWSNGFLMGSLSTQEVDELFSDNLYFVDELRSLRNSLAKCMKGLSIEDGIEMWKTMAADTQLKRHIMAILFYISEQGLQARSFHQRAAALLAASIYILFLRIPGHGHVQFFHSVIFQKVIGTLKTIFVLFKKEKVIGRKRAKNFASQQSQSPQAKKRKRRLSLDSVSSLSSQLDDYADSDIFSDHEIFILKQYFLCSLQTLVQFLRHDQLKGHTELAEMSVMLLVALTVVEPTPLDDTFGISMNIEKTINISHLSYLGLLLITVRANGVSIPMVKQVAKALEKNLLLLSDGRKDSSSVQNIPKQAIITRDNSLLLILQLMKMGGDSIGQSIKHLLQSMILSVSDKSEYRTRITQSSLVIMDSLNDRTYSEMCLWIFRLSKYKKGSGRMMAVEIIGQLLISPSFRMVSDVDVDIKEVQPYTTRSVMLQALLTRCSDKLASVMAKALSMLASCLNCDDGAVTHDIQEFMCIMSESRLLKSISTQRSKAARMEDDGGDHEAVTTDKESRDLAAVPTRGDNLLPVPSTGDGNLLPVPSTGDDNLLPVPSTGTEFTGRGSSAFTFSKFATQSSSAFSGFYLTKGFDITLADSTGLLSLIKRRLNFTKAVVRRAALQTLESFIKLKKCDGVEKEVEIIRDHCRDVAVPIRKQAIVILTQLVQLYPWIAFVQRSWLQGVLPCHEDNETSIQEKCWESIKAVIFDGLNDSESSRKSILAWELLSKLLPPDASQLRSIFCAVCVQLHKKKFLPSELVSLLTGYISSSLSRHKAVWMLLSILCPILSSKNKSTAKLLSSHWLDKSTSLSKSDMTYILMALASLADCVNDDMKKTITDDLMHKVEAYNEPACLVKHMIIALVKLQTVSVYSDWALRVINDIENIIDQVAHSDNVSSDDKVVQDLPMYLLTLGELCVHSPQLISKKLIKLVQSLVILPRDHGNHDIPQFIKELVSGNLPSSIRRASIFCLGKICLQHELEAKQSIPSLAHDLETSSDPVTKRIIVTILCDLCRLFANSVGPYVACMSSLLKDPDVEVRKQTFIDMTRLLREDYLKLKGALFYRFLSCVVDDNSVMSDLAKQTFIYELSRRHKTIYTQHFVECVFHFNDYRNHKTYNQFKQTDVERALFSLDSDSNCNKRFDIYIFMLNQMADSQKFSVTQKLCQDVLSAFADKVLPLGNTKSLNILIDTLKILQSKEIKLSVTRAAETAADEVEELDSQAKTAASRVATAATAIKKLVRKDFIETAIPDIITLKQILEASHSPALRHLMFFLIEITKDYKQELTDIFTANPQLAAEISYDIKKFEEVQANAREKSIASISTLQTANPTVPDGTPVVSRKNNEISTPLQDPKIFTPGQAQNYGTPVMPPPPIPSSAVDKSSTKKRELLVSLKRLTLQPSSSEQQEKTPAKRVSFANAEASSVPATKPPEATPLRPTFSAAVGARAISTPDQGTSADFTFSYSSFTVKPLSPILRTDPLDPMCDSNTGRRSKGSRSKTQSLIPVGTRMCKGSGGPVGGLPTWSIKSPLSKKTRKSPRNLSRDLPDDCLTMIPSKRLTAAGENHQQKKSGKIPKSVVKDTVPTKLNNESKKSQAKKRTPLAPTRNLRKRRRLL